MVGSDVSPESSVLLHCARVRMDAPRAEMLRGLCQRPLDWNWLAEAASRHGVDQLLHRHLHVICPERVPPAVAARLRERFTLNAVRNRFLGVELRRVLVRFERHGICAIAYKGPTLALSVYGDLTLRRFADLDLLLDRSDVARAKTLLIEDGYRCRLDLTPREEQALLAAQRELILEREGRACVELHWQILPREFAARLDLRRLWSSVERVTLDGTRIWVPGLEDLLLILCAHGAKHLWERLGWVVDVAEVIRTRPSLRWEAVLAEARRAGSERMVLLGLGLADELLDADLPDPIRRRIRDDRTVERLTGRIWRWHVEGDAARPSLMERERLNLKIRERLGDRVRYAVRRALVSTIEDWHSRTLPPGLFFLHAMLRPLRLARKHAGPERRGA